jgi:hypothetical protein
MTHSQAAAAANHMLEEAVLDLYEHLVAPAAQTKAQAAVAADVQQAAVAMAVVEVLRRITTEAVVAAAQPDTKATAAMLEQAIAASAVAAMPAVVAVVAENLAVAHLHQAVAALVFSDKAAVAVAALPTTQATAGQAAQLEQAMVAFTVAVAQVEKTIHLVQADLVLKEQYELYGEAADPGQVHLQPTFK